MRSRRFEWIGLLMAVTLLSAGCSDNGEPADTSQEHLQLHVVLDAETLYVHSGNVSHINGYAQLTGDWHPEGLSGQRLNITLVQPWLSMRYTNDRLRDVTDDDGRVPFFIRDQYRRESHYSTVQADWGCLTASDSVWIELISN